MQNSPGREYFPSGKLCIASQVVRRQRKTVGKSNFKALFKALFEAIEREQHLRGNL
ncbi:MAG TPA: hypothetical protein VK453_09010 [Micromonosporaceae bacterium]|nr:hypothetical protein [Micromonosporaceae bacterium]